MSCIPTQQPLNEVELLMQELQLRMTRTAEASPRLYAALQEPRAIYAILAEFFESQLEQSRRAKDVALEAADVRRVWAFCLEALAFSCATYDTNAAPSSSALSHAQAPAQSLDDFVRGAPSLPLEALQRGAPVVDANSVARAPSAAATPSSPCTARSEARRTSVFSILRSGFAGMMDLAYVADQRLQRPSSSGAISVVSLAALAASLVPTLDRVQAVRLTAQIADDVVDSRITSSDGSTVPPCSRSAVATLLAGVWHIWGVLDAAHSPTLYSLGQRLFQQFATPAHGRMAPNVSPVSFAAWLQRALRENNGALHQQLYADAEGSTPPAKKSAGKVDAAATRATKDHNTAAVTEDVAAVSDFWAWLAS
ncbi:hypothetical protein LINJ_23_0400 [Leishmania infantum JPCM5]|uniref:Uncharacterized protein n=3 Tax=Leishmania donovani species complex TaxID=38574 RepID=E9AH10_LEIIN|nr:hypothetical protein LINJ_23_0400 [Leishmania infantum JPCM5]XP_003860941.1 hypothetical protein LDBPK_230400 [Leishmania donovani]CAC9489139.1 hypothetical_protein_-_conserved [Leishmania infantum]TPP50316.1 hypothetical protein CGC21_17495 [Leishmania donovani]CBZ08675.1 hypothetical protein LINJ_23_0400 [Leishmania infantum JPCM5]CBZ34236.1 hypothetical protein LDBPK_230400 [Leishmania donovani]SUZ41912.1 hypothetical_protein_-_conserved [Leishmania infantum]|eukprot:XP_003392511.1 hypothetical protein LINJ_23_0400 [Leishmania infantum JPCM5]